MKRILAFILCSIMVLSLFSCKADKKDDADTAETTAAEDTKNVQNYDELEYKSDARFTDDQLFDFNHASGKFRAEKSHIVSIFEERFGVVVPFNATEAVQYVGASTPFGVTCGNSLDELIEKHALDTGFAAYVKKGGAFVMYDEEKEVDITGGEGGCMYFGYAKDGNGDWAFMDYIMLTQLLEGKLVVKGNDGDYDVVVYSCIVNNDKNITKITQIYGEIGAVMAYVAD